MNRFQKVLTIAVSFWLVACQSETGVDTTSSANTEALDLQSFKIEGSVSGELSNSISSDTHSSHPKYGIVKENISIFDDGSSRPGELRNIKYYLILTDQPLSCEFTASRTSGGFVEEPGQLGIDSYEGDVWISMIHDSDVLMPINEIPFVDFHAGVKITVPNQDTLSIDHLNSVYFKVLDYSNSNLHLSVNSSTSSFDLAAETYLSVTGDFQVTVCEDTEGRADLLDN